MPNIYISEKAAKRLNELAAESKMSKAECLEMLLDFFDLKTIDLLLRRIKLKHVEMLLTPADKAALAVLKIYLEKIVHI